jgi:caffeoyl-CoA O-methyltransferase
MAPIPPEIERYAEEHTTPHDELLAELARETYASMDCPQMLTGPVEGRFLQTLVHVAGARRVLEIGTFTGYSALSMAAALPPGGRLDTCEVSETHAEVARRYFARSPHGDRITLHMGPANETIPRLDGEFDVVFVDADKTGYPEYYELVLPRLSARGVIAFDNTLQDGRVLEGGELDESTRAIAELNDRLVRDERVVVAFLTVRDGVTLVRRSA